VREGLLKNFRIRTGTERDWIVLKKIASVGYCGVDCWYGYWAEQWRGRFRACM